MESKALLDKNVTAPTASECKPNPQLRYFGTKTRVEFSGSCLKQEKIKNDHGKAINIYIVYEINKKLK